MRETNRLLDSNWDDMFGRPSRDRRLLPLFNEVVALVFTAMGFSLEALFATAAAEPHGIVPIAPWAVDEQIESVSIRTALAPQRIADGVVVYHGIQNAFEIDPELTSVEVVSQAQGADLLLCMRHPDRTWFTVAQGLLVDETFRIPHNYRQLVESGAASVLIAVEGPDEWALIDLDHEESQMLHGTGPDHTNSVLRALGYLES